MDCLTEKLSNSNETNLDNDKRDSGMLDVEIMQLLRH